MDTVQTIVTNLKEFSLNTSWAFGSTTDTQYLPVAWGCIGEQVPEQVFNPNVPTFPYSDLFVESPLLTDAERIENLYTAAVDSTAGWLSSSDPYWASIGVTPPAEALYGYTLIPESLLDKAWPCNQAELDFSKVKLLSNAVPVDNTWYEVNEDGLWWTQAGYEYSPLNTVVGDDKNYTVELFTQISSAEGDTLVDESQSPFAIGTDELILEVERTGASCKHVTQAIRCYQGQSTKLELPLVDMNGSDIVIDDTLHNVTLVLRQAPDSQTLATVVPTLQDDNKTVEITLSVSEAGIYKAQLLIGSIAEDTLLYVVNYYLVVEPVGALSDMVTIDEIRMHLMDACPDENKLILSYEYKDADILNAMRTAVDYFNGFGIKKTGYTPGNMPATHRYFYKQGISALLLRSAGLRFARNELPYSAGGVSVNDQAKAAQYFQLADVLDAEWKDYVMGTKQAMNMNSGFWVV